MRSGAQLASPIAALTSLALHALLLASGIIVSAHASTNATPLPPDAWSARSVEVGTIPDAAPKTEATPAAPAPAEEAQPAPTTPTIRAQPPATAPSPKLVPPAPQTSTTERATAIPEALSPSPLRARRTPRPSSTKRAVAPARSGASAPEPATSTTPGVDAAGSIGATGLPPGVRHLATAFTRALPAGAYKDAAWTELPLGRVGDATIALHVTDAGRLEDMEVEPEVGLAPALQRMLQRVVLLLKSGTFSLDSSKVSGGGVEHLAIEVTLSTRPANPDELAAPSDLFAQSFAPPKQDQPGYARFTLNSGRHVEAIVRLATPK